MIDHLKDRAFNAIPIEREDAQRHKTHVADTRKRNQPLDIRLDQRHVRAPHNGHCGDHEHRLKEEMHAVRKDRKRHSQKTVSAHFEKDSCQNNASRCWSLGMGVGKPRMHRKHRNLHRERS